MNIGKYIHAKLTAAAPVVAIVGERIYPVLTPSGTTGTGVVYMVSNVPHGQTKDFAGTHDVATVTLHLWADVSQGAQGYSVLEDLDAAIRVALDYVEATAGGVTVESAHYDGSVDGRDEQNLFFLKTVTYTLVHRK